jgi:aryl-alcohol dehydrogenase-like predicted oxidoreductase
LEKQGNFDLLTESSREGKIKYIGLSAISSATLRRAVKIAHVDAVQTDYSLFQREIEGPTGTHLLATCRELGVAVVVAMPLGRGMITSTFASGGPVGDALDKRPHGMPRFMEGNKEKNVKIMSDFKALADKKGFSVAQLALAWLLKQGDDIFPIPGTKKLKYVEENWAALDIQLSDEEEKEIRHFVEGNEVAGPYLPPRFAGYNYIDTQEEN